MIESPKKRMIYLVILLLTFVTVIIGTTIAYFSLLDSQKPDHTHLYTGKLEINYIDGVYVNNPTLEPLKHVNYNTKDKVYRNNFAVRSSGTLDQTIKIVLNITTNEFSPSALKYVLYSETGHLISSGFLPSKGDITVGDNLFLANDETNKYLLIIWLDNKGYTQNSEMGKHILGRISITSTQIKY